MYPAPPITRNFHYPSSYHSLSKFQAQLEGKQIPSLFKDNNSNTKNALNPIIKTGQTSRQSTLDKIPAKRDRLLINPSSHGTLQDRIHKERRAHTMAPAPRIFGPSSTPRATMFATTIAPTENQMNKPQHVAQGFSKMSYGKSDIELPNDDRPIIIKVRYDPQAGGPPTEDAIRKAIGHRIYDRKTRKEPIIVNFLEQNRRPQIPNPIQQNIFSTPIVPKSSHTFPSIPHTSHRSSHHKNTHSVEVSKSLINREQIQPSQMPRLPNRDKSLRRTHRTHSKGFPSFLQNEPSISLNKVLQRLLNISGFDQLQRIHRRMATHQPSSATGNQKILANRQYLAPSSGEVFRPPAVNDIPELSRDNLLNMLNQIPDLQGRRFNIEYAPPSAPEGYPIPLNIDTANNAYPEPVIIDRLPTNVIQHVKNSNNPALTAALEATIQQEQYQSTGSSLNVHPTTVVHHSAQPYQQVQQSRPVSSNDSDSSTEVSSSETSSSEETDSEESEGVSTTQAGNNHPYIGPIPPTSFSQNQHC